MLGLLLSESSMSSLSGLEWNKVHHSPGMSLPLTKCWASPPVTLVVAAVVSAVVGPYPLTSGAEGFLKVGPTEQPTSITVTTAVIENTFKHILTTDEHG